MVYGYETNKEFIDKSYQLFEKLNKKGLWNKDTLVIGLDKSVRPLVYTLRKLSDLEGKEKPDMRFFNFGQDKFPQHTWDEVTTNIADILKDKKDLLKEYDKILILDEYAHSGITLLKANEIIMKIFDPEKAPKLYSATLINSPHTLMYKKNLIFVDGKVMGNRVRAFSNYTGIQDKYESIKNFQESTPIKDKGIKKLFSLNRYQLSKDIKDYLHKKHPEKISERNKGLEKIISGIFVFSFLVGLFLSSGNLTGNVIGNSGAGNKLLGIVLVLVGIGGFFVYRKLK